MGRSGDQKRSTALPEPQGTSAVMASTRTPEETRALEDRNLIRTLQMKLSRSGYSDDMYGTKRMLRMAKDIGILRPEQQKALIRLARTDPRMAGECERLYVLTNLPMALKMAGDHAWREGYKLNEEDFLQYAMLGLHDAFKSFDFDAGAIPSVHNWNKIRGRLSHAGRALGWTLLDPKSASELHDRVRKAQRDLENQDLPAGPKEIAAKLDEDEAKVRDVLRMQAAHAVNLDRQMAEGDTAVGETIADENAEFANTVVEEQFSQAVRDAITSDGVAPCSCCPDREPGSLCRNALSELEQHLVIAYHDIDGDGQIEQNELFDGVYEDASGRWYSSEDSVINDREARLAADPSDELGGMVTKMAQSELTVRFDAGELTFIPGNDHAKRVFELLDDKPPTQARVQAPLTAGYDKLRAKLSAGSGAADLSEQYRSRGRNAIEHSGSAEQLVRDALISFARQQGGTLSLPNFEQVSVAKIERMKAGRVTADGSVNVKSQLREYGEALGLIDIDTGALKEEAIHRVIAAQQSDQDSGTLMQTVDDAAKKMPRKAPKPQMQDIFSKGLIPEGKLVGAYKGVQCEALYDGTSGKFIVFSEGKKVGEAETPSVASKLVSKEENGYNFWAVEREGKRVKLRELRNQCAQLMMAEEPVLA